MTLLFLTTIGMYASIGLDAPKELSAALTLSLLPLLVRALVQIAKDLSVFPF